MNIDKWEEVKISLNNPNYDIALQKAIDKYKYYNNLNYLNSAKVVLDNIEFSIDYDEEKLVYTFLFGA